MEPCHFLDWESDYYAYRLARVDGEQMDAARCAEILAWCQREGIEGLFFLAQADDAVTNQTAAEHGFVLRGIRVTLDWEAVERAALSLPAGLTIRLAQAADVPALEAIADGAYPTSRYCSDPHFPAATSAAMYTTWIRISFTEQFADAVFVAERGGEILGFSTCDVDLPAHEGSIPLVGIAEKARGQGIGTHLMHYIQDWFVQQQIKHVIVVADGANIAALRLYEKCGFRTRQVQLWYHKWFCDKKA